MFLTDSEKDAAQVRKWSTQSREPRPWYEHEEIGYNYRMSNVIAGVVRGQIPYLEEHIAQKKAIYERYKAGFAGLPVQMNPYDAANSVPNYWLSCMLIDESAVKNVSPEKILGVLTEMNAEGRPIWKPMHMQPVYTGRHHRCNPRMLRRIKNLSFVAAVILEPCMANVAVILEPDRATESRMENL